MKIFYLIPLILLTACGPSPEEKQNIAIITCNVMGESRNMDASMRIKEINLAREKIKAEPYLKGDAEILESFEYGLCVELVLADTEYENKIFAINEVIRISEEKAAEEARVAREKAAEEARVAAEKARKEKIANTKVYTLAVTKVFEDYPPNLIFKSFGMGVTSLDHETINVNFGCENLHGLSYTIFVVFKNNIGQLKKNSSIGHCPRGAKEESLTNYSFIKDEGWNEDIEEVFYTNNPKDQIESIYLQLEGGVYLDYYKENFNDRIVARDLSKKMDPETYGLNYGEKFNLSKIKSKFIFYGSSN